MANFLIKQKDGNYQTVLQVSLKINSPSNHYTYEKYLSFDLPFIKQLPSKGYYEISKIEDILLVESLYKSTLLDLVKCYKLRKQANHRAQVSNLILSVQGQEVFNLREQFPKLWEVEDNKIEGTINNIKFNLMSDGVVYSCFSDNEYLI
ncbi:MAG: hypothetical protein UIM53_02885 [Acutalibacteraceae bacterium]|nr:hypothetical protein [Acutalibacteraceae bacterium]